MVINFLIINKKSNFNYLLNYSAEMLERNQSLEFERSYERFQLLKVHFFFFETFTEFHFYYLLHRSCFI